VSKALREARARLAVIAPDEAELEAEVLLRHALGVDRVHLYQRLDGAISEARQAQFEVLLARRLAREPLAYIVGHIEFFGLKLEVTPGAIIPRPETETLVDLALACARDRGAALTIVDVGTGAGTIAVPLALELPAARVIAIDSSGEALALARRNAERHGMARRINFRHGDLLAPLARPADMIVANLPYVTTVQWEEMPPEIRDHEPRSGLDGGRDGLDVVRRLLTEAPGKLAPHGALFCEIGAWQGMEATQLAREAFPGARIEVRPDLAGRDRVLAVYAAQGKLAANIERGSIQA
jgi:release factor glutamine methyltransferase